MGFAIEVLSWLFMNPSASALGCVVELNGMGWQSPPLLHLVPGPSPLQSFRNVVALGA